jgi:uncharacterized protein (TIGR03437 family)
MISHRRFLYFVFLLSVLPAIVYAQRDRIPARIEGSGSVVLQGHVNPKATAQNDLGAAADSYPVPGITMLLKPDASQKAALQQLLAQQQDTSSPNYHKWLTPEQYADQFGVSANDVSKIVQWLQSQGFVVTQVARSRMYIMFDGSAGQVHAAFGAEIHRYNTAGEMHYANANDPSVPAALASVVASFRGLTDFRLKPHNLRKAIPEMTTSGGVHHLAPGDLATIYDIAPLYQAGTDGTGQTIMVVGQTAINVSDISSFRSAFGLSAPNLNQVKVPGRPNPGISSSDLPEADLDIEWSGAVAKNATIVFVYSDDVWQSAFYAVDQNLGTVLTMSYGLCEQSDLVDLPSEQAIVQQANAQGITWLAASGDQGAGDCEDVSAAVAQNGLAVDAPSSIPEVTGMGGLEFNEQGGTYWSSTNNNGASALSYIPEKVWNDTAAAGELAAGGGGASTYFPRPSWQTGTGVPNDSARHVPDIALASSDGHDSYYVFTGGGTAYYGGTSFAAPVMAGVIALLNQYLVSSGIEHQPGLANINPTLYRLAQSAPSVFHDITVGDNSVPCASGTPNCTSGSFGYSAAPAYDQASGLGSVDVANLVHQWSSAPPVNSAVVPSIDQNPVFQQAPDASGNSWVFTIGLQEEAGIGATLTDFTIDGASYASQIATLFGGASIPPDGSISARIGLKSVAVPKNVVFVFVGIDASGKQWSTQMSVPFQGPQTALTVGGVSNAASGQQVYAPGMILSVYGTGMGNFAQSAAAIPLPQYLAGFEATINGVTTPLYYVSPGQVNLQIPYETQPGLATLTVGNPYVNVNFNFQVASAGPGIFVTPDGVVNPSRSGAHGQIVTLFITGDGQVSPALPTGDTPSPNTPLTRLPQPRQPVSLTVGNVPVTTINFIGIPSGLVGVTQINFTVPASAPSGVQPVVVTVGGVASQPANFTVTQ